MCSLCGAINGHLPGCPEAPDVEVGTCELCGDPIYAGEPIYKTPDGDMCHADCVEMNALEILESLGYSYREAEV